MFRRMNLLIAGIAAVLVCSYMGFFTGLVLKDRSEGWISVPPLCLWSWGMPKTNFFALRTSSIDTRISFWGPRIDNGIPETVCTWGRPAPPKPKDSDENGYQHFFMNLRNPGEFRSVAVIEINCGEVVELNPRRTLHPGKPWQTNYDYGPIPPLTVLTSAECDQLWGSSETIYPGVRTYKLKAFNDPEDADYFLDTAFDNGHLKKYRIRSSATRSPLALKKPAIRKDSKTSAAAGHSDRAPGTKYGCKV